jgi:ATP-binding cassette, subfamily B, bacterial
MKLIRRILYFFKKKYPFFYQLESMDCGPSCLRMIAEYYGQKYTLNYLRTICFVSKTGISMQGLVHGAKTIGFNTIAIKIPFEGTAQNQNSLMDIPLPAIAFWASNHFVVIYEINKKSIVIGDSAQGRIKLSHERFRNNWLTHSDQEGVVLLLQPEEAFYTNESKNKDTNKSSVYFLLGYLKGYSKYIVILLLSLIIGSGIQYLFPFFTRSIIDLGIEPQKLEIIYVILIVQLVLYTFQTAITFLQNWIILHLSSRINILLTSDFLFKLTRLPISFFDTKTFGEIIQRINDHKRVEIFLSVTTLSTIFSTFSLVVFGFILFQYNPFVFLIFFSGTSLYLFWIFFFLRRRKAIDYELFSQMAKNNELLYEYIYGMQEIKLQNSEKKRTAIWMEAQKKLLRINIKSAKLSQFQDGGAFFINQFKDILITVYASIAVINDKMSIGMLLATQLMLGLLYSPVQQIVGFIRNGFETKLSLNRISEIHSKEEEYYNSEMPKDVDINDEISIENVAFKYNELDNDVLKNISFTIPKGKVTAIVGASGSGKTTLIKLLLGFYKPQLGEIFVGERNLNDIYIEEWRRNCGAVLQDGYIFSDTIANNIAESDDAINLEKLANAINTANLDEFIITLALKEKTLIGSRGNGLSQGQKQRVLIARAVYKNPNYLFFDEATNALDTQNEKTIVEKLNIFYAGKTVVVVAHRLSTVKNADQIILLDKGVIAERGTHNELVALEGIYFNLVSSQLELSK